MHWSPKATFLPFISTAFLRKACMLLCLISMLSVALYFHGGVSIIATSVAFVVIGIHLDTNCIQFAHSQSRPGDCFTSHQGMISFSLCQMSALDVGSSTAQLVHLLPLWATRMCQLAIRGPICLQRDRRDGVGVEPISSSALNGAVDLINQSRSRSVGALEHDGETCAAPDGEPQNNKHLTQQQAETQRCSS